LNESKKEKKYKENEKKKKIKKMKKDLSLMFVITSTTWFNRKSSIALAIMG